MSRRVILLLLVFILALASGAEAVFYQGGNQLVKESEWQNYKYVERLPSELPYSIEDSYGYQHFFNRELWEVRGLIVYGDYRSIYPNDYKDATLNPAGHAYYQGGEFRYHGYSLDGSKFNNLDFPDDMGGSADLFARNWIYEPWQAKSVGNPAFQRHIGTKASVYNELALNAKTVEAAAVAKWINQSVDFISRGTWTGKDVVTNLDPIHYLNVDLVPTAYQSGQGTLFHVTDTDNVYYQTVPIERYRKESTPINAEITDIKTFNITEAGDIVIEISVRAEILDDDYFGSSIRESIYYTRHDINEWKFIVENSLTSEKLQATGYSRNGMKEAYYQFLLPISSDSYGGLMDLNGSFSVSFLLEAEALYTTGDRGYGQASDSGRFCGILEPELVINDKKYVVFSATAPRQMLDVDSFKIELLENDVSSAVEQYIEINGVRLNEEQANLFLSGNYRFPAILEDRIYQYSINYISDQGEHFFYRSAVIVYDSVPHIQLRVAGSLKENRRVIITADKAINSDYLQSRSTIAIRNFMLKSENEGGIFYRSDTDSLKDFISKNNGQIAVSLTVGNQFGERDYDFVLYIAPDHSPDIIAHIWKGQLARGENLDIFVEASSLDGDEIGLLTYEILSLEDNDWRLEASGTYDENFSYAPTSLGQYKIRFTTREEYGEETLTEFISPGDYRSVSVERDFLVDNLFPVTMLFTDIEHPLSNVELVILLDEGLNESIVNRLKNERISLINHFRSNGINALIELWDLKGQLSEQTAYQTLATGSSYPPASLTYNKDGYSGTLQRTSVNNYPYTVDYGSYYTFSDSKTAATTGTGYSYSVYYKGVLQSSYGTDTPSLDYYDAGGYSGVLYKDKAWQSGKDIIYDGDYMYVTIHYTASYSGTVTRTWREWVPDYVTYNDYYGNYSGKVTKLVKQDFNYQFSTDSSKYIVYYTNNKVNNLGDYNKLRGLVPSAETVLIGSGISGLLASNHYIEASGDYEQHMAGLIDIVQERIQKPSQLTILLEEEFSINYTDIDYEGDPLVERGLQYVHNADFLDNTWGLEEGCLEGYSESAYGDIRKTTFSKPGHYTIYRRVKDEPIGRPDLGGYSNVTELQIIAHRAPVANIQLVSSYNQHAKKYDISYVDLSYDPDFQFKRSDKGIVSSSFKYRSGNGDWIFSQPHVLAPGSYQFEYQVLDCYGVWSDPYSFNLQLPVAPPAPALSIKGYVKHTDRWDANRRNFNFARSGNYDSPLTAAHFFAGEELVLEAVTSGDPLNVFVELVGTNLTTELQRVDNNRWQGSLWNSEMMTWSGRTLLLRFYAAKANTPTVYDDVVIEIVDENFWRQHRLY